VKFAWDVRELQLLAVCSLPLKNGGTAADDVTVWRRIYSTVRSKGGHRTHLIEAQSCLMAALDLSAGLELDYSDRSPPPSAEIKWS
jgi:hypothetical protein